MPFKPLQAAGSFAGIPDIEGGQNVSFGRTIDVQDGIPLDGSNAAGRTYSPFLIRVLLPNILNGNTGNQLETQHSPQRSPQSTGTVRNTNPDPMVYTHAQNQTRVDPSGRTAFDRLVTSGGVIDGITRASEQSITDAYNQALFQQQFGPTVRNVTNAPTSDRTNTVTPALTNDTSALSVLLQLKQIASIPPLLMLINPTSMSVTYTKIAQHQNRSRYGYIYEAWGEEMPRVSFTFRIGAYTAGLANINQKGSVVTGVQRASRNDSASFQQLQNLLALYQGATYVQDTEGGSRAFPMVGNLAIEYDQRVYVGHMESFNFTDDEGKPHGGLDVQIEFVANKVFDLAVPSSSIQPMIGPNTPQNSRSRGALQRSGSGNSISFFTVPGVGGTSPLAGAVSNAWESGTGIQTGAQTGVDLNTGVVSTRRR